MAENRELTVSLPEDLLNQVGRLAAERGVSASELAADALRRLIDEDRRYSAARERALERLRNAPSLGTNGQITWTRDEIHER